MSFTIQTENGEVVINDNNFSDYFFDVRTNCPRKNHVLSRFSAVADFVEGRGKQDIIYLLKIGKVNEAVKVMQKIHSVRERDSYRVLRMMSEDLLTLTEEEVEKKPYEMVVELFFYTKREYVPKNKYWETIPLVEFDKESGVFKSSIEL